MNFDSYLYNHETFAHSLNPSHICDWPEDTITPPEPTEPTIYQIWYTTEDDQEFDFAGVITKMAVDYENYTVQNTLVSNEKKGLKWVATFENPLTKLGVDHDNTSIYPSIQDITGSFTTTITSILLPNGLIELHHNSLRDNTKLTGKLVIPEGVTLIGEATFESTLFTTLNLPSTVNSFDSGMLNNCSSLTVINYNNNISNWITITKASDWKGSGVPSTTYVQCLDGKCDLDGNPIE